MEVWLCLEEMELGLPLDVIQGVAECRAAVLALDRAELASVPAVARRYPTNWVHHVTLSAVPSAVPGW